MVSDDQFKRIVFLPCLLHVEEGSFC